MAKVLDDNLNLRINGKSLTKFKTKCAKEKVPYTYKMRELIDAFNENKPTKGTK